MKQLPKMPEGYWLKYSQKPVSIYKYDPHSLAVANNYISKLKDVLNMEYVESIYHRGSTSLKIQGKGDIEIGVIPKTENWFEVIVFLSKYYKDLGNLDEEYCRFNDTVESFDIEIILFRGYTANLDKKLHQYLLEHKESCEEYERIKKEYCYSEREYNRQKDKFFRSIVRKIPD